MPAECALITPERDIQLPDAPRSILVVDDEAPLRKLMQVFLERLGYQVETCGDATEGLGTFKSSPERFALVVAGLSLPDLPGNEMALQMLAVNPNLRVLLCSGYPFEVESLPADKQIRFASLQKPFLPNMLSQAVEELLAR